MESKSINVLTSFPLISELIPYYSTKATAFILLSSFSKDTRTNFSKHYAEFRRLNIKLDTFDINDWNRSDAGVIDFDK